MTNIDNEHLIKFTDMRISTMLVDAKLSNISFHEKEIIDKLVPTDCVLLIGCNFGEKYHDSYVISTPVVKSNRGRKKKIKVKKDRQIQGSGKYLNSQVTFLVKIKDKYNINIYGEDKNNLNQANESNNLFKVKVFRTGKIQIPGLLNYSEEKVNIIVQPIIEIFADALKIPIETINIIKGEPTINIVNKRVIWRIENPNWIIDLIKLKEIIISEHNRSANLIVKESVNYNPEKSQGLSFKINLKPIDYNINQAHRYATCSIYRSGKVNIDVGNMENEHKLLYDWLLNFLNTNKAIVMYYIE
jgi:hypothetical protein